MAEKYGVEVNRGLVTIRSAGDIVLASESATGTVSTVINGAALTSSVSGVQSLKSHTGYAGSDFKRTTVAVTTTDATATAIFTVACPVSTTVGVWVRVVGKKVGTSADGIVSFKYQAVTNAAGTTAVVGTTGGYDLENASGTPAITIVADDTADTLVVKVTGIVAETWAWVAAIEYMQVTSSS